MVATGEITGVVKGRYVGGAMAPLADVQIVLDRQQEADSWFYDNKWSPYGAAEVEVSGGTVALKEILLEQPGWVTGTVRDAAGQPVANASVMVQDTPSSGGYSVTTDSNGVYETRQGQHTGNMIPGAYTLSASNSDWEIGSPIYDNPTASVQVSANQGRVQDFVLKRRKTAVFTVLDIDGSPLVNAPVSIWVHDPETGAFEPIRSGPHETDTLGRYRFIEGVDAKFQFHPPKDYTGTAVPEFWDGPTGEGSYALTTAAVLDWPSSAAVDRAFTVRLGPAPTITPGTLTATKPRIVGKAKVGKVLRVKSGTWGPGKVQLKYQWFRGSKKIPKATSKNYRVTKKDARKKLKVKVTGTKPGFTAATRVSRATKKITR